MVKMVSIKKDPERITPIIIPMLVAIGIRALRKTVPEDRLAVREAFGQGGPDVILVQLFH